MQEIHVMCAQNVMTCPEILIKPELLEFDIIASRLILANQLLILYLPILTVS